MFYPAFRSDWVDPRLARTRLPRGWAGLLRLGHLRTLEALGNGLFAAQPDPSAFDLGQAVAASRLPWRRFKARAERASLILRLTVERCTPRDEAEAEAIFAWLTAQTYMPPRAHQSETETRAEQVARAHAQDHAATPTQRLALAVAAVPGWAAILRTDCVWDAPLIAANHLLIAAAENQGACHFPADLILGA